MMTFGSLFAGIGGFDLGLERAGMQCAWQVEIDPFCQKVLAKHWPDVPRFEDVRNVGRNELAAVDLVCGGFPCQPHSHAGKRQGAADDRDLWPEYRRIIAELRPRWVIGENVPGIRSTILDGVLSDLGDMGYSSASFIISAAALGAGNPRYRVFIIAHSGGERLENIAPMGTAEGAADRMGREYACLDSMPGVRGLLVHHPSNARARLRLPFSGGMRRPRLESIQQTVAWYEAESGIRGVAHGVPSRVDRLRALGNAVVPQVVEFLGRLILEVEAHQ